MKRIKRTENFEVTLVVKEDNFINPPKAAQRNAVVNRALKEFSAELNALNEQTKNFVPGETVVGLSERGQAQLTAQEIMEDWQIPLMKAMAKAIAEDGGDILEVGFGRGISADMIQEHPIDSHTIIECNDLVIEQHFKPWKSKYTAKNIRLVHSLWQDCIDDLGLFDGIFFHTYPLNEDEYMQYVNASITFAEHFFHHAAKHLKPGGSFTYFSNEIASLSREHQHMLLKYFSSFSVHIIPLDMPTDVKDTWWADSMVIIKAVK
ncbi:class I SAM-dependent methyltransferase [uncultured Winogradskyella sp.]|uniref:class I SAM-dependent methyltransferase n=1 Tax=Winogradskyella sp. 4-2091 TaxID=3381659 RepID=UPI002632D694|nr:class I SAM-dependent methyltransferase [uncultured Winogradskyella sp.]